MTPDTGGRHCAMCCKTVIDFTLMSDAQIIDIFKRAGSNPPCGRFLESQLNRDLADTRPGLSLGGVVVRRAAAILLLVQSAAVTAFAQGRKMVHATQHTSVSKSNKKHTLAIKGIVLQSPTARPLAGIKVLANNILSAVTDSSGRFIINIPASPDTASYTVTVDTLQTIEGLPAPVVVTMDELRSGKEVTLYIPVIEPLPVHAIKVLPVIQERLGGPMLRVVEPEVKKTFVSRVTRPFKRKKKGW